MKTIRTLAFVLSFAFLVSSFATPALAAPTAVELVAITVTANEDLRVLVVNNDAAIPGAAETDTVVVRLYNTRGELVMESEPVIVAAGPGGGPHVKVFDGPTLARLAGDENGRADLLVELEYSHDEPGRKGARWQTTLELTNREDGKALIGMLLPAVQKVR